MEESIQTPWFETTQDEYVRRRVKQVGKKVYVFFTLVAICCALLIVLIEAPLPYLVPAVVIGLGAGLYNFRFVRIPGEFQGLVANYGAFIHRITLLPDGLDIEYKSGLRSFIPWPLIPKVSRTETGFEFVSGFGNIVYIPKRALEDDLEQRINAFLARIGN